MLPLWTRVNKGEMVMKRYSILSKAPVLQEPHHQIALYHIQATHWASPTPLQSVYSTAPANWAVVYFKYYE